jgi:hypothetical protein
MESESAFEWFVLYVLPLLILCFGLIGNTMGIVVLARKKMDEIGPLNTYRYIFIFDSIYILTIIVYYLQYSFSIDYIFSFNLTCKFFVYFVSTFSPISSLLLIYILIERYLSISYPVESNILNKNKIQSAYLIIIMILNLAYYSPVLYYYRSELKVNSTLNNYNRYHNDCNSDSNGKHIISILSFISKALLPLFLIILFSIILVYKIIKSKSSIATFYSDKERLIFKKDVKLSIISIFFNLIQFSFYLPLIFAHIISDQIDVTLLFTLYIYYFSYAFNFYFLLVSNSLFRNEFWDIFIKKKPENNNQDTLLINLNQN